MSKKSVKSLKPDDGRRKVALLYNLCSLAEIDIEEELAIMLPLIYEKIRNTRNTFKETHSQVLNTYKISGPMPYNRLGYDGEVFKTFYEITEEDLKELVKHTYLIKAGHSLIGDIEELIDEISEYAPKKDRDRFVQVKLSIAAKAPDSAKVPVPGAKSESATKLPTKAYTETSFERTTNAPTPSTKSKSVLTSPAPPAPPKPNPQKAPKPPKMDPIKQAVSLSESKGLPVYFNQVISGKKVKKGIYCRCTIDIHGENKVSKKAIFIDCKLA